MYTQSCMPRYHLYSVLFFDDLHLVMQTSHHWHISKGDDLVHERCLRDGTQRAMVDATAILAVVLAAAAIIVTIFLHFVTRKAQNKDR